MRLELPEQAIVNTDIPKNSFFKNVYVTNKLKQDFTHKIQKIRWTYKLSEDTINIPKTNNVEEIQVFEIELKERDIPHKVLHLIDKAIPYPILYTLRYQDSTLTGLSLKRVGEKGYYFSDWNQELDLPVTGHTLEEVYQNLIKAFVSDEPRQDNLEETLERQKRRKALEKEIAKLEKQIKRATQFKQKADLNMELQKKRRELERMK